MKNYFSDRNENRFYDLKCCTGNGNECGVFFFLELAKLFWLGFTPCKAEQPLRGMKLLEKEAQKG